MLRARILLLHLDPPRHAAVFCVDEKAAVPALDRRDRVLLLSAPAAPNAIASSTSAMVRFSLYAALNTKTGHVHGKTAARRPTKTLLVSF